MLNLKLARIKKGLSQDEVGDLCGVSGRQIGNIERGDNEPSYSLYRRICKVLGLEKKIICEKCGEETSIPKNIREV